MGSINTCCEYCHSSSYRDTFQMRRPGCSDSCWRPQVCNVTRKTRNSTDQWDASSQRPAGVSAMAGCAFPDCNPIQDPPGATLRSHFPKKRRSEMCSRVREGSLLATLWDVTREAIKIVHSYCEDSPVCCSLKAYTQLGRHGALFSLVTPMFTSMLNHLRMNLTLLRTHLLTPFSSVKLKGKGKPSQPHRTEGI